MIQLLTREQTTDAGLEYVQGAKAGRAGGTLTGVSLHFFLYDLQGCGSRI